MPSSESSLTFQVAFSFSFTLSFALLFECVAFSERELWDVCTSGNLELVKHLANDPAVDVNWADPEYNRTGFYWLVFLVTLLSWSSCSNTPGLK